jgi:hypothetical protein
LLQQTNCSDEDILQFYQAMGWNTGSTSIGRLKSPLLSFEKLGGKVVLLPARTKRIHLEKSIGIRKEDELIPICHAGMVRSQIMRMVFLAIKQKLGIKNNLNVRLAHGIKKGYDREGINFQYDYLAAEQFEKAFSTPRPFRYGGDFARQTKNPNMIKFFQDNYYFHVPINNYRKIFTCFADTGITVINKLLENIKKNSHAEFSNDTIANQPMQGIIVLMIPDGDWISNYRMPEDLKRVIIEKYQQLKTKEKREKIQRPLIYNDGSWLESFDKILHQDHPEIDLFAQEFFDIPKKSHNYRGEFDKLDEFAERHIYQQAFKEYAKLFQPIDLA